ncbi:hypothetical protein [Streptomyces sp. NPDC006879]|uniref:hypothetical protein n=1 Tax=Streptomyces sp. NPDC006879 TaxID=3364767 RepID=UPI0036BE3162
MDIAGGPLRAVRAALFSALVVLLSAASHVLLSQVPLPVAVVAGLFAGVFLLAYALAGQERGYGRIAALLIPLELFADTVFTSGQHVCYGPAGGPVAGPLRAVGLDLLCGGAVGGPLAHVGSAAGDPVRLLAEPGPSTPWLLLAAHLAVGLLAAAWLRRGERALRQLLGAAGALAFRPLLLAVTAAGALRPVFRQPVPAQRRGVRAPAAVLVHSVGRRGPPLSTLIGA